MKLANGKKSQLLEYLMIIGKGTENADYCGYVTIKFH